MSDSKPSPDKQAPREIIEREIDSGVDFRTELPTPAIADNILWRLAEAGYAIVPVEPSEAMLENAAIDQITLRSARAIYSSELPCAEIWRAMVEAAQ